MPRATFTIEQLQLIEDALTYYRMSTEADGPDDHTPDEIRKVERHLNRILAREES